MRVLLVGAEEKYLRENLAGLLSAEGIEIGWHWSWNGKRPVQDDLPDTCRGVIICQDMAAYSAVKAAKALAEKAQIPVVTVSRTWEKARETLRKKGFTRAQTLPAAPPTPVTAAVSPKAVTTTPKTPERLAPDAPWAGVISMARVDRAQSIAADVYAKAVADGLWTETSVKEYADHCRNADIIRGGALSRLLLERLRGEPLAFVLLLMGRILTEVDVHRTHVIRAYSSTFGKSLGPYYAEAAAWLLGRNLVLVSPEENGRRVGLQRQALLAKKPVAAVPASVTSTPVAPPVAPAVAQEELTLMAANLRDLALVLKDLTGEVVSLRAEVATLKAAPTGSEAAVLAEVRSVLAEVRATSGGEGTILALVSNGARVTIEPRS